MSGGGTSLRTSPMVNEDQKVTSIVEEVDRFFQSVHADIEDWKFSMEDYGDGTRIFVRFQIHINKPINSEKPPDIESTKPSQVTVEPHEHSKAIPKSPTHRAKRSLAPDQTQASDPGDSLRAEMDLSSFIDVWRRKRARNQGAEFHKEGAPYLETQSEWDGHKRQNEADHDLPSRNKSNGTGVDSA